MTEEHLDLNIVQRVMSDIGDRCVLIGGWASYLHLRTVALSHDVDTILSPLEDKGRVAELIGAHVTHLNKLSGELHGSHVDLYVPHQSVIGGVSVEKLLPYSTEIDGIRVLIPEAHLLTKAECIWDNSRFLSDRSVKDTAEVRGMMELVRNPRVPIAIWSNISTDRNELTEKWNILFDRIQEGVTKKDMKRGFADRLREWKEASIAVAETQMEKYGIGTNPEAMFLPVDDGVIARFHFKGNKPFIVETLDGLRWSRSRVVTVGAGKQLLQSAVSTHPYSRAVPGNMAQEYGRVHGTCLVCNRALSSDESVDRGYGPDCVLKVR